MGIFGKNKEKENKIDYKKQKEELEKQQNDLLIAMRTKAEFKLEKSAIVTLMHVNHLVRTQTIVNEKLTKNFKKLLGDFTMLMSRIDGLIKQNYKSADEFKSALYNASREYWNALEEYKK